MTLYELLQEVRDETSFLEFARALQADRAHAVRAEAAVGSSPYGADAGGWENISIESYLRASISWAESTAFGRSQNIEENPWTRFAVFLYVGKIYE